MSLHQQLTSFFVAVAMLAAIRPIHAAEVKPVKPGEFIIDPPTLINLGFEWIIEGDDNRNAAVAGFGLPLAI